MYKIIAVNLDHKRMSRCKFDLVTQLGQPKNKSQSPTCKLALPTIGVAACGIL
jgi:hypothetical protein